MSRLPWALGEPKPLIGMLHLDPLPGQPGSPGFEALLARARADLRALEEGGAAAAMLENWKDESPGPFLGPDAAATLGALAAILSRETALPLGVNALPNDYRTAFGLVPLGVSFVWLDVFVDRVRTDYAYSPVAPFEVEVDHEDLRAWRARLAPEAALLASVHPKHYALLDEDDTLEAATTRALEAGADAIVVTGAATGSAPDPGRVARVRAAAGPAARVIVGSGVDAENAAQLMREANGAIVGSSLKTSLSDPIDPARVRELVARIGSAP